jgi:hypothetical protein
VRVGEQVILQATAGAGGDIQYQFSVTRNYHFLSCLISTRDFSLTSLFSQSLEVSADGTIRYIFQVVGPMYRSFRMPDLYSPPQ